MENEVKSKANYFHEIIKKIISYNLQSLKYFIIDTINEMKIIREIIK